MVSYPQAREEDDVPRQPLLKDVKVETDDEAPSPNTAHNVPEDVPQNQLIVQNKALGVQQAAQSLDGGQQATEAATQSAPSETPILSKLFAPDFNFSCPENVQFLKKISESRLILPRTDNADLDNDQMDPQGNIVVSNADTPARPAKVALAQQPSAIPHRVLAAQLAKHGSPHGLFSPHGSNNWNVQDRMRVGKDSGPEQQVIRKNDKPNDVEKTQRVSKMGTAPRAPKRGSNSNAHPPIFSQATTDAYSKKIRELENLLAMQCGKSKETIERLLKENDEFREEVHRLNIRHGNLAAQMGEIINQKDQELASKTLYIGKCHNYMTETAKEYDSKMKEMKEKLEEAARIQEENDKRHQEDQKKQEELQKKIDELMASQNVFYTLVSGAATQLFNQDDNTLTTSSAITEAIARVRTELTNQTTTGQKRQLNENADPTEKKKARMDNDEESD